jgi:hypothetical protein
MAKKGKKNGQKKDQLNEEQQRFATMSRDEQAAAIRPHMAAGGSYTSLSKRFAVGVGRIAGICRDYDIPSTHPPGFSHVRKSTSGAVLRFAVSEADQCEADVDGHRCGYVRVLGSRYCPLPQHQALEKKRR